MGKKAWELTEDRVRHLNACSAQGMGICSAAKELGVDMKTVKAAAERAGKSRRLIDKFPNIGKRHLGGHAQRKHRKSGLHNITLEELRKNPPMVDTSLPHVRVAIMPWRVSA